MRIAALLILLPLSLLRGAEPPKYKNPSLPVEERVDDLVSLMTLDEKIAQLQPYRSRDTLAFDSTGRFVGTQDTAALFHGVGAFSSRRFGRTPKERALRINGIQRYLLENTRLGIPAFVFGEALHGFMAEGATSFPQAIALGSTWDTLLVEKVFIVAALEASSRGTRQVLSPVLDLARDPRWGRFEECYGEDPYLVSRMGVAAVRGFQGRGTTIDRNHVAVTLKHFAGHGQPEGGRNIAPLDFGEREFRESHLLPFEAAVTAANAQSLMASYNEWDGIPNHANPWLLTNLLRGEWGFKGYVMSDGGGMDVVYRDHAAALDSAEAGRLCLAAGLDYDLGSRACFRGLAEAVAAGRVSAAAVDRAVRGVLRVKFTCGLFEDPFADPALMERITNCAEHRALALEAAHKAMVLLKNTDRTLPLDSATVRTLAVIGPNAAEIHLGGYSPFPMKGMSVLDGIREFAGDRIKVLYAEGCRITMNKECHWQVNENPLLPDPKEERKHIAEAVKTAKKSDAVVLVLGENELVNREAWSDNHLGDRDGLDLVGLQEELAEAVFKTGKPCVVVLINGRPIALRGLSEKAAALLECWYLGQETGRAVADALFGRVNPSGRLTVTVPRSVGQLPCYYNRKPSRFRNYVLADSSPLYPFGFGLSYTTFAYSDLSVSPPEIQADGTALVTVSVANTGGRTGEETVQLYVRDAVSLPTRPVKELKDFCRIRLTPGETRFVTFTLTPEKLAAFGLDMRRAVQPGRFELMVGTNSEEVLRGTLIVR